MQMNTLIHFFMWCTIINILLMIITFILIAKAGDAIYKIHYKWFPIQRERFYQIMYSSLVIYKILILAFNLVPWIVFAVIS
jgi:hypothetical protein